ncbi:hypothetical protein HHI36_013339 [Cryptolaemus montrouzieri]|uniref:Uncharacterized protein n=1 Tax=Cryptolaemus montrouzieri TaxID=559131 RepID=A0ABD2NHV6_9CUCU
MSAFVTDRPIDETTNSNIENIPIITQNMEADTSAPPPPPLQLPVESATVAQHEISTYTNPVAGCSKDIMPSENNYSPKIIRPYPKSAARTKKITRKTRKLAFLTDTPEKNALALEESEINKSKSGQTSKGGKTTRKKVNRELLARKRKQLRKPESFR